MYDPKARIVDVSGEIFHKIRIQFDGDQNGIATHAPQDFSRESAYAGPVFNENTGALPVHLTHHVVDQKMGTGDHGAEHRGALEKIPGKQSKGRASCCGLLSDLHRHPFALVKIKSAAFIVAQPALIQPAAPALNSNKIGTLA